MIFLLAIALMLMMPVCCLGPGLFFVRRLKWDKTETLCTSIGLSLVLIYLAATSIYLLGVPWSACWAFLLFAVMLTYITRRDIGRLFRARRIRDQLGGYGFLVLVGLLALSLIRHYSGGSWSGDWLEHYDRATFFLNHDPHDKIFIGLYTLPARPPMMNLLASFFMSMVGQRFELFQIIFMMLNALVLLPCVLVARQLVRLGGRHVWVIAAILAMSPFVLENMTWTWTKLLSVFYVILALSLYLRGWRKQDPRRVIIAAGMMAAGIIVHYSAAPFAIAIAIHYMTILRGRRSVGRELFGSLVVGILVLMTWLGWSIAIYGVGGTVATNTTVTDTQDLTPAENLLKIGQNIGRTLIPHPLRLPHDEFRYQFYQPNPLGFLRDYFFTIYQTNLPLAFGLLGGIAIILIIRSLWAEAQWPLRRFWFIFLGVSIPLGIAVHGSLDRFGVTHVSLQPVVLIGLTLLAAGIGRLPRGMRAALVLSLALDLFLGVFLQQSMQQQSPRMLPDYVGALDPVRNPQVVPYHDDLLALPAVQNSALRHQLRLPYLADHFQPIALPLYVAFAGAMVVSMAVVLGRARLPRVWHALVMAMVVLGAASALADRFLASTAHPASPAYERGLAAYQALDLDGAATNLTDAMLLDPFDLRPSYLLRLLLATHSLKLEDTEAWPAEVYRADPNDPSARAGLAAMLRKRGYPEAAARLLRQ